MSLKLLVDEDSQGRLLVSLLRQSGYDVQTVNDAGLRTTSDNAVFSYSIAHGYVILTQNCADFSDLASASLRHGEHHPGVLLVYKDNDVERDMNAFAIVQAIKNLEDSGFSLEDQTIALNNYDYISKI